MRVFMLGWEFPPFISGGLGTACYGLTKALSSQGIDVVFVLPRPSAMPFSSHREPPHATAPAPAPVIPRGRVDAPWRDEPPAAPPLPESLPTEATGPTQPSLPGPPD